MKKFLVICFLLFSAFSLSYGQILSGKVCDAYTKKPIPGVDVYFEGTSISTVTDKNGDFKLPIYKVMNTNLIIHHLSYKLGVYASPFDQVPKIIYLEEDTQRLSEVVVSVTDQYSRVQKMKIFKEFFMGSDKIGKSCYILNEDDVNLYYNKSIKTLIATAKKPLIIRNRYLGYEITFLLKAFTVEYSRENTLNKRYLVESYYAGMPVFKDLFPDQDKEMEKRRMKAYEESSKRFFKSLVNNTLKESKFSLWINGYPTILEEHFRTKDTLSMKMLQIIPNQIESSNNPLKVKKGYAKISVYDKNNNMTDMLFRTDRLLVDMFGNINAPDKVAFYGYWGEHRLGHMLPLEYDPE